MALALRHRASLGQLWADMSQTKVARLLITICITIPHKIGTPTLARVKLAISLTLGRIMAMLLSQLDKDLRLLIGKREISTLQWETTINPKQPLSNSSNKIKAC